MEKDPRRTPGVVRTATRMSTRRKPTKELQEPESSILPTRSHHTTRKVPSEKVVQECGERNSRVIPTAPTTRRRVHAMTARGKVDIVGQKDDDKEDNKMNENVPQDE